MATKRQRLDESGTSAVSDAAKLGVRFGLFGDPHSLEHLPSLAASLSEVVSNPSVVAGKVEVDRVAEWVGVAVLNDAARVMGGIRVPLAALLELDADEGSDPSNAAAGTAAAMPGADCGCSDDTLSGYAVSPWQPTSRGHAVVGRTAVNLFARRYRCHCERQASVTATSKTLC